MNAERWENEIANECARLGLDAGFDRSDSNLIVFVGAKIPSKEDQDKIIAIVPKKYKCNFFQGPRISTLIRLSAIFQSIGVGMFPRHDYRGKIVLEINRVLPKEAPIWEVVRQVLVQDAFVNQVIIGMVDNPPWELKLDEVRHTPEELEAEEKENRPPITPDDITNLKITLGECNTVDEFIKSIGG